MSGHAVESSGQKAGLWVLGLVVVAAVVGLVWKLGPGDRTAKRPPAPPASTATARTAEPTATTERRQPTLATDPDPDNLEDPKQDPEVIAAPPLAELLTTIPNRVIELTTPCYKGEYRPDNSAQRVVFRYTLSFNDGWVRIQDVSMLDSDMDDTELRNCVLETARSGKWEAPGASRHVKRVQQTITVADLSK